MGASLEEVQIGRERGKHFGDQQHGAQVCPEACPGSVQTEEGGEGLQVTVGKYCLHVGAVGNR